MENTNTNTEWIDVSKQVQSLIAKAEKAENADYALKFSQAACNAANAAITANNDRRAEHEKRSRTGD